MFSKTWTQPSTAVSSDPIEQLKGALASADAVVVCLLYTSDAADD